MRIDQAIKSKCTVLTPVKIETPLLYFLAALVKNTFVQPVLFFFSLYFTNAFHSYRILIEVKFFGINMVWVPFKAHFNPSLNQAQNIFMPLTIINYPFTIVDFLWLKPRAIQL